MAPFSLAHPVYKSLNVSTQYKRVTDGQTDRCTERNAAYLRRALCVLLYDAQQQWLTLTLTDKPTYTYKR